MKSNEPRQPEEPNNNPPRSDKEREKIDNPWQLLSLLLDRLSLPMWAVLLLGLIGIGAFSPAIVAFIDNFPDIQNTLDDSISPVVPDTPEQVIKSHFDDPPDPTKTFEVKNSAIGELNSDGSVSMVRMMREIQTRFTDFPIVYGVDDRTPSGSKSGKDKLKAGAIQMALLSEDLTEEDKEEGLESIPIGRDAIAVVVHKDNPINSLTITQLRKIYTCEIRDWSILGWPDDSADEISRGIDVFNRSNNSGTKQVFKDKVLGQNKGFCQDTQFEREDGSSFTTWEEDKTTVVLKEMGKYGIYFASINHVINDDSVKILEIGDVYPDEITILDGAYSLTRELYVAAKKETYPEVITFINFIVSFEGQKILSKNHIPIYKYWE